jgi:hypothetical protein
VEEAEAPLDQHAARRAALTLAAGQLSLSSLKLTTEYLRHEAHSLFEYIIENIPGDKPWASFMGWPMWASYALIDESYPPAGQS